MTITQPLRGEHQQLLPHIEHLRAVADDVGEVPPDTLAQHVGEAHRFLTEELIPHAEAEDAWLYPAVGRLLGDARATETMRCDHVEVGRLTAELGALVDRLLEHGLDSALARELRRVLYGLHALVSLHFAKEEEVYLPLLEQRLSAEEAHELFAAMHHTGHDTH